MLLLLILLLIKLLLNLLLLHIFLPNTLLINDAAQPVAACLLLLNTVVIETKLILSRLEVDVLTIYRIGVHFCLLPLRIQV